MQSEQTSAGVPARGHVEGQPVLFEQARNDGDEQGPFRLAWRQLVQGVTERTEPWDGVIEAADIIAIVDDMHCSDPTSSYEVLFISQSASILALDSDDEDAAPNTPHLGKLSMSNLPARVLSSHYIPKLPSHLKLSSSVQDASPNLHVIVSSGSGTGFAEIFFSSLLKPLFSAIDLPPSSYLLHTTQSPESVSELTTSQLLPRAHQGISQTVVLLSGDGGVHDVVNALLPPKQPLSADYAPPTLALLALGTGNALAHSLRLTRSTNSLGLRALLRGSPRRLPLFRASFSPGAEILADESRTSIPVPSSSPSGTGIIHGAVVFSYGLHATLVSDSDTTAYRVHGASRFQLAAKDLLYPADGGDPHAYRARLTLNPSSASTNPVSPDKHSYILATLVSNLERNFTISPATPPLPASPHLVRIPPVSSDDLAGLMSAAYKSGAHTADPKVLYTLLPGGLRIDFLEDDARWRRVCVDGTIVRVVKGGWAELAMREGGAVVDVVFDETAVAAS
ncbi:MAG: hypothetical protein M1832_004173 [Thelocarpon impressellum]|nr:MAG: hypothetical protein M1832_004173 [Thelocarpon impressellum]